MATVTLTKEVELSYGVLLEVEAEFGVDYVDNGIGPYEYWGAKGYHHDWGWEAGACESFAVLTDITEAVEEGMKLDGWHKWNPAYYLVRWWRVRKITKEAAQLDPDDIFDADDICEAAPDQCDNDDPPDRDDYYDRHMSMRRDAWDD